MDQWGHGFLRSGENSVSTIGTIENIAMITKKILRLCIPSEKKDAAQGANVRPRLPANCVMVIRRALCFSFKSIMIFDVVSVRLYPIPKRTEDIIANKKKL